MKKLLFTLLLLSCSAFAQFGTISNMPLSGRCPGGQQFGMDLSTNTVYSCTPAFPWKVLGSGGNPSAGTQNDIQSAGSTSGTFQADSGNITMNTTNHTIYALGGFTSGTIPPTGCTGANGCISLSIGGASGTPTANEAIIQPHGSSLELSYNGGPFLPFGGGGANSPIINVLNDCPGVLGAPNDDAAALQSCVSNTANYGANFVFPQTVGTVMSGITCNYTFSAKIFAPKNATGTSFTSPSPSNNGHINLCWTADTGGFYLGGFQQRVIGLSLMNFGGGNWVRSILATYGVPTTHYGVQFCGGGDAVIDSAIFFFSSDGVHISDSDCAGGTTDWATADNWMLERNYYNGNKGYGYYIRGGDSNVGMAINNWGVQNQLGVMMDSSNYGNTHIDTGGDSNASDPNAPTSTVNLTSCTETRGNTVCLTASPSGLIEGDWISIIGNTSSCLSTSWEYVHVIDTTHFQMPTGCTNNSGTTTTGGTVGALPGAHVWAVNSLLAGGMVAPAVNGVHFINPYLEGTNGKAIIGGGNVVDGGEGLFGNIGGFQWINNGVSYARVGTVNTVQNQPAIRNANGWNFVSFKNINPLSGNYSDVSFYPGICSAEADPGVNGCSFGIFDGSGPGFGASMNWARNPHANSFVLGGYFGWTSSSNDPSSNYRAWSIGTTDQFSTEGGGVSSGTIYGVDFNGILHKGTAGPGTTMFGSFVSGENWTGARSSDLDMECDTSVSRTVATTCRWLGTRLEIATFSGLTTTPLGVIIYCSDCTTTCGAGSSGGQVCLSLGGTYTGVGKQPHICTMDIDGGSLAGTVIASSDSLVSKCYNALGSTAAITTVRCWSDNSGTTSVNPKITGGSNLLTSALTCSPSWALGTLSGSPTLSVGSTFDMIASPDGTTTKLHLLMVLQ